MGVEIGAEFSEDVFVSGLFHVSDDDALGIGLGGGAGESELLRGPEAEEFVSARLGFEFFFLVESEAFFKAALALIHGVLCHFSNLLLV